MASEKDRAPLRVLFVEDSPDDLELELRKLQSAGFDASSERVEDAPGLRNALAQRRWDLVIADYNLPTLTGFDALIIVRALEPDLPFVLVSGTIGEERAVEALKAGADDYVLKDRLARLPMVVRRVLEEAATRRERRHERVLEQLLSKASAVLPESLEERSTVARVAQLLAEAFGDRCIVDVFGEDGALRRAASAAPGGGKAREPPDPPVGIPAEEVLQLGRGVVAESAASTGATGAAGVLSDLGFRSWLAAPIRARGDALGTIALLSPAAERVHGARDLAFLEELARRVAFALDNARLYGKAREAIRVREEFVTVAAHELRTPLTSVQAELARLHAKTPELLARDPAAVHRKIERAARGAARLATLVETLLDLSAVSAQPMRLAVAAFDLAELVGDVVERARPKAERAGSRIDVQASPTVGAWDRSRIEQIVDQLLSNAIKYGGARPIEIELGPDGTEASLVVRDRGIGFDPADAKRIFTRFERAVSADNYGGLGLGLYITAQIVAAHGGRVEAHGRPGAGATFTVRLPLHPPAPAIEEPPSSRMT
jgi:signal transduction histidine kinase/CheY-like chemotaxis protein